MKVRERCVHASSSIAVALATVIGTIACGAPSTPASASIISPTDVARAQTAPRLVPTIEAANPLVSVPLVSGRFTIAVGTDALQGIYTGQASVADSSQSSTLDLTVTGGSGVFQGASGTLQGTGTGAFAGEGAFALFLKRFVSRPGRSNDAPFRASIGGMSQVSCVSGQIQVAMQGRDPSTKRGPASIALQHSVGGGG